MAEALTRGRSIDDGAAAEIRAAASRLPADTEDRLPFGVHGWESSSVLLRAMQRTGSA